MLDAQLLAQSFDKYVSHVLVAVDRQRGLVASIVQEVMPSLSTRLFDHNPKGANRLSNSRVFIAPHR